MNATDIDLDPLLVPAVNPAAAGWTLRQVGAADPAVAPRLLQELARRSDEVRASDPAVLGGLLRGLHLLLLKGDPENLASLPVADVTALDAALPPGCPNRHLLLQLLMMIRSPQALRAAVARMIAQPPNNWQAAGQVLSSLMQHDDWPIDAVFPEILETLSAPALASPVLDVANHVTRCGRTTRHPASDRSAALIMLLAGVTSKLEQFERDPRAFGEDIASVRQMLADAVSLAVSLCDALGLIGEVTAIPRLAAAMQLKHRRVQTEAAGALARFGDPQGIERLLALAEEPSARLRVIAYADELGLGDRVPEPYRSQESTAEAAMALWLSQPSQMAVPPTTVETIDRRHQYWPGFEQPLDCFLVRFHYDFGGRSYSNVGISGPVTFALANDLADLPVDDIYAIYAGWQAEHEQIFAIAADHLNEGQRRLVARLAEHAKRAGYLSPEVELFGCFFEEQAAVFRAVRENKPCRVITDGLESLHLPLTDRPRQPDAADLWNLYKGRKLLRSFNSFE